MTKEQRAARKPLLAKIRRLEEKIDILQARAYHYYSYYKKNEAIRSVSRAFQPTVAQLQFGDSPPNPPVD